jgi:hypothetical protein
MTWTISTTLNGDYAIDPQTQLEIDAEIISIDTNQTFTNEQTTHAWPDAGVTPHASGVAQFKPVVTAITAYLDALVREQAAASTGQSTTRPSASVTIIG